jgi:hypothetical protein
LTRSHELEGEIGPPPSSPMPESIRGLKASNLDDKVGR